MSDLPLRELAGDADEVVRRRARVVQDTLSVGPTSAARKHGVTRQTAAKWTALYRAGGAASLSRPTRQRRTMEQMRHAIWTAPLWMPTTKWSSRSIAAALGVSQSYVARAWDAVKPDTALAEYLTAETNGWQPRLTGVRITSEYSVLVFRLERVTTRDVFRAPAHVVPAVRSALRTILAADLVRARIPAGSSAGAGTFWREVTVAIDAGVRVMTLATAEVPSPAEVSVGWVCRNAGEWQSLFSVVNTWGQLLPPAAAQELEKDLRAWANNPRGDFSWVLPPMPAPRREPGLNQRSSRRHMGPERALADEIVLTIRQDIAEGRLAGGDRVTERYLTRRLRTTRAQVRAATRLLERDGMLTITTGRAAVVVPVLTTNDVVETYAARRALGGLVIRAAVRWSPEGRRSVMESLDALERCASTSDVYRTGEADIDFQNALAMASGLVRIAPMLELLADHVRMFMAVMGLGYAYPVDDILRDDRLIFAALDAGDGEAAVERWRIKMNDAMAYMLGEVGSAKLRPTGEP